MNRTTPCGNRTKGIMAFLFTLFLAALSPGLLRAQAPAIGECQGGLSYVVAFPDTSTNTFDNRYQPKYQPRFEFFIYSSVEGNRVRVGSGAGASRTIVPQPGKFERVPAQPNPVVNFSGTPSFNTFKIEADYPIVVYAYFATPFGGEAFTPIPVESWGTEYYANMMPGEVINDLNPGGEFNYQRFPRTAPAEITVLSAFDDTRITIYNTAQLDGFPKTVDVELKAYQAYQIQSYVDTATENIGNPQPDLAGSIIISNNPIGVIATTSRTPNRDLGAGLGQNSMKNPLMEAMASKDQMGKKFVYLPAWDNSRPTGEPGEKTEEKRPHEIVRIVGVQQDYKTEGYETDGSSGARSNFGIDYQKNYTSVIGVPAPRYYETDTAAIAMHSTSTAVRFNGTTLYWGNYIGASYDAMSVPWMVEMTPREQWVSFAPFYAAPYPTSGGNGGMSHYLNLTTEERYKDSVFIKIGVGAEQPFVFNRGKIPGTDLIWGTIQPNPGVDYYLRGNSDNVKFYGFVYGNLKGTELYRPGKIKKNPTPNTAGAGDSKGKNKLLHPSEYEEYNAMSYAYPLAPSRCALGPGDSLLLEIEQVCDLMKVKAQAINEKPVGMKSIVLEKGAINTKLVFIDPLRADLVVRKTKVEFDVRPINKYEDAEATVVITDRTGKKTRIPYKYYAERLDLTPQRDSVIEFGQVTINTTSADSTIKICNPLGRPITVKEIELVLKTQRFEIVHEGKTGDKFTLDKVLQPGECFEIKARVTPNVENRLYEDSVKIKTECGEFKVGLRAETSKPCIYVDDLDFGSFDLSNDNDKQGRFKDLKICNQARSGKVFFNNPSGQAVVEWLNTLFTVTQADIDRLKSTVLGPGECVTITVKFTPDTETGVFTTTARFWANVRDCRDTSVWIARVTKPGPQIGSYDWQKRWLSNTLNTCTKSDSGVYVATIPISNNGNSPFTVTSIALVGQDFTDGYFALDMSDPNLSVSPGDVIQVFDPNTQNYYYQRVLFRPKDERKYHCEIVLSTSAGEVRGTLDGEGIESHINITDNDFGRHLFTGTGSVNVSGTITIVSPSSTRPTTITRIELANPNFDWAPGQAAVLPQNSTPWVLAKDSAVDLQVIYLPQASGDHTADIILEGDFTKCEPKTIGKLSGRTYTLGVSAQGHDFGNILTCENGTGFVTVTNTGEDDILIESATLVDPNNSGYYNGPLTAKSYPIRVAKGATEQFEVQYAPTTAGNYPATVHFVIRSGDNSQVIDPDLVANITGSAFTVQATASIAKGYVRYPGTQLQVPVTLEDANLDPAKVASLQFTINYEKGMLALRTPPVIQQGTLLEGWTMGPPNLQAGNFTATFTAPAGQYLQGNNKPLLILDFLTFLGEKMQSDLPFTITLIGSERCASVVTVPGDARIDSVCGLNFRLIKATEGNFALDQNKPNPFNPTTEITFGVGLDGQTSLVIYNAVGERVATLVNQYLQPGNYTVTWDATGYPSGLYYYRLNSGHWSKTNTMILSK